MGIHGELRMNDSDRACGLVRAWLSDREDNLPYAINALSQLIDTFTIQTNKELIDLLEEQVKKNIRYPG